MSHLYRFYVTPGSLESECIELEDDEAHHALRVVRVQEGQEVTLFDGQGTDARGIVEKAGKRKVRIAIEERRQVPRDGPKLTLVQAWLNREKSLEDLVRRGTELGVQRFVFFKAEHSERKPRIPQKWARLAIESCKQTGNVWLPAFDIAESFDAALESVDGTNLLASQQESSQPLRDALSGSTEAALIVGPEGDFSPAERILAIERGAKVISLGAQTFRSEVAAVIGAALVLYEMGGLGTRPGS